MNSKFFVLTGVSGSGKKTALHALEDMGFFCVENLPAPIVSSFVDFVVCSSSDKSSIYASKNFALLVDCRDEYAHEKALGYKAKLIDAGFEFSLLFFEAQDDVLLRRFKETRRPHPIVLHEKGAVNTQEAVQKERELLANYRANADLVVDTSTFTPHQLRKRIEEYLGEKPNFEVRLQSFGFKYGLPNDSDLVVDVRFLPNPHFVEELKEKNGTNKEVSDYVFASNEAQTFLEKYQDLLDYLIPKYQEEGKRSLTVSVGCTGGKHRSVAIVEKLFKCFVDREVKTQKSHRDV